MQLEWHVFTTQKGQMHICSQDIFTMDSIVYISHLDLESNAILISPDTSYGIYILFFDEIHLLYHCMCITGFFGLQIIFPCSFPFFIILLGSSSRILISHKCFSPNQILRYSCIVAWPPIVLSVTVIQSVAFDMFP